MKSILFFGILIFSLSVNCNGQVNNSETGVLTGADLLVSEHFDLIKGKSLGIVTNHTAILKNGVHLVDTLNNLPGIKIVALFGPEHGIRGDAPDGLKISDGKDQKTGIPVFSLYGKINKPTKEMLKGVDFLIFDIQDIGARFYTFISTMYYTLQAAAENNIPVIVLDRPNPIGGLKISGPVRAPEFKSFVGIAPIPIMHGMTVGELALMFNDERYLEDNLKARLKIVEIKNWKRDLLFDQTNLIWLNPSPNIVNLDAAMIYPGLCLLEGTNLSEGRGTLKPFLTFGAPYINSELLIDALNKYNFEGINFSAVKFTPVEIPNMASNPKHLNKECNGIELTIDKKVSFDPIKLGIAVIYETNKLFPGKFEFREKSVNRLYGSTILYDMVKKGKTPEDIYATWTEELKNFVIIREKYLLY